VGKVSQCFSANKCVDDVDTIIGRSCRKDPYNEHLWAGKVANHENMLQINVQNIQHIKTYGFEDSMQDIMSTVEILMQHRQMPSTKSVALMQTAHELSIPVMIGFFCESGLLQGDEAELLAIKKKFLDKIQHTTGVERGSFVYIVAVLRHITSMALCGAMYAALPTLQNICPNNKECANTEAVPLRSWASLQKIIHLGEVLRLSFVLEENLKKRAIVPDDSVAVIVRNVVKKVHTVVERMQMVGVKKTTIKPSLPNEVDMFSKMVSNIMGETLVASIMCIETPGKAKYAYSIFCVNLLDLYGE